MKEIFVNKRFHSASLALIEKANEIIAEYQDQGFTLTLRQLYYQFVARGLIPNKQSEYKRLGSVISDGRLAGLIDWDAIEDRTRRLNTHAAWDSPQDIIEVVAKQYKENLWAYQPKRIEVWIEKDALLGVVEPVCTRWRIPYFACRGYASQSAQYEAGQRLLMDARDHQRRTLILHLGDHDPSGIDMTRDNSDRLRMFGGAGSLGAVVDVKRIALNFDQVQQYNPPPNPTKDTDTRSSGYRDKFGGDCWELDALDPIVIDRLIESEVLKIIDQKRWNKAKAEEKISKELLQEAADRWSEVVDHLRG